MANPDTRLDITTSLLPNATLQRTGERADLRWFYSWWAPIAHALLSPSIALLLVFVLGGKQFLSSGRDIPRGVFLSPSDVTTIISGALVLCRLIASSCILSVLWRCAIILLQHDGLDLRQLSRMIAYRIPIAWGGRYTWSTATVLAMMLPSTVISPLLSGSLNWSAATGYNHNNFTSLPGGFGSLRRDPDVSYSKQWVQKIEPHMQTARRELLMRAFGFFSSGCSPVEDVREARYIAIQQAPINTIVFNVPMPYIEVHSLTWDKALEPWVQAIIDDPTKIVRAASGYVLFLGTTLLFGRDNSLPAAHPDSTPPKIITTSKKIAILSGDHRRNGGYLGDSSHNWGNKTDMGFFPSKSVHCWAVGTVNFTVGIRYYKSGRYITRQAVEAIPAPGEPDTLVPDNWSELALAMVSDVMASIPIVRLGPLKTRDITKYARSHLQKGYISVRSALKQYPPNQLQLQALEPVIYLQANVNHYRVFAWLVLNSLVPIACILVLWMEKQATGRIRVIDTTLVALLTDVREILAGDANGVSNMSHLTNGDHEKIGKIQLGAVKLSNGGEVLGLIKARDMKVE